MANALQAIVPICRFCLCEDEQRLCPITATFSASLTHEDVERFTGIQINPDEDCATYAICHECANRLRTAAEFRCTCLKNDIKFQELFMTLIYSAERAYYEDWECEELSDDDEKQEKEQMSDHTIEFEALTLEGYSYDEQERNPISSPECQDDDAELYSANYIAPDDPYHSETTDESRTNPLLLRSAKQRGSIQNGADLLENVQPNVRRPGKSKGKKRKILDASIVDQSPGYYIKKYKAGLCVRPKTLCEVCGVFVIGVRRHLLNHRQESLYGCPHCPVKMKQKSNIMAHINTVHFKTVGKTCGICGKGFVHHKTYRYHMLTHESTGKRFECKDCSKTFSNEFTQRDHFKRFHSFECKLK